MMKLIKHSCSNCKERRLFPLTNRLIYTLVCSNCGNKEQLTFFLGGK